MKKKFSVLLITVALSIPVLAQNDAFFGYNNVEEGGSRTGTSYGLTATGIGFSDMQTNQNLPLGSGLLLLSGAGLAYAFMVRKERTK